MTTTAPDRGDSEHVRPTFRVSFAGAYLVIRGLDPRIHIAPWMAGSSPAMTEKSAARVLSFAGPPL